MTISLITGCHRSGSTWLGTSICKLTNSTYVWEPCNLNSPNLYKSLISNSLIFNEYWYPYFHHDHQFWSDLLYVCRKRRLLYSNLSFRDFFADRPKRIFFALKKAIALQFSLINRGNIVIKDPLMLFCVEAALASSAVDKVVILTRDPRGFFSSLKKANWAFDFSHLIPIIRSQPHLSKYKNSVLEKSRRGPLLDPDSICLLWNILHEHILYLSSIDSVSLYKYEDVSIDPSMYFPRVAQSLLGKLYAYQLAVLSHLHDFENNSSVEDQLGVQMVDVVLQRLFKMWVDRFCR